MYNLPADFSGFFFIGTEVRQICFSQYHIDIHFSANLWLQVFSGFEHYSREKVLQHVRSWPLLESSLVMLVGVQVTAAVVDGNDLMLTFADGQKLVVIGSDNMYECYIIFRGDQRLIV